MNRSHHLTTHLRWTVALLGSVLFCSCATQETVHPELPPEISINQGAGRGDLLLVTLQMEHTNDLLFVVDTGAPFSLVDKSLEPLLGRSLGTGMVKCCYGTTAESFYTAPKLYLGDVELRTGRRIATMELRKLSEDLNRMTRSNHRLMGILGMDCLRHYCVQFDFTNGKMRFLDPDNLNPEELGKAFPLGALHRIFRRVYIHDTLVGGKGGSTIDTGCNAEGWLTAKLFRQWTNDCSSTASVKAHFPNVILGGVTYTNLFLRAEGGGNLIGLSFLARNLVTFNFPKRTMYLKQTSVGPLADDTFYARPGTRTPSR